jgi:hypothetical protein
MGQFFSSDRDRLLKKFLKIIGKIYDAIEVAKKFEKHWKGKLEYQRWVGTLDKEDVFNYFQIAKELAYLRVVKRTVENFIYELDNCPTLSTIRRGLLWVDKASRHTPRHMAINYPVFFSTGFPFVDTAWGRFIYNAELYTYLCANPSPFAGVPPPEYIWPL